MSEAKQIDFLLAGIRHPETDEPLAGGYVWAYEAGGTTPKDVYLDRDTAKGVATNPFQLDSAGRAEVFGNGIYRFVIRDSDDSNGDILYEIDNAEYIANLADAAAVELSENLDFLGLYKGINLVPGTNPGDTATYGQLTSLQTTLQGNIDGVTAAVDALTFLDLTDTISSYASQAGKIIVVNETENALVTREIATLLADGTFLDLSDTPSNYTGNAGKAAIVNTAEDALEFGYPDAKTVQGIEFDTTAPNDGDIPVFDAVEDKVIWQPPSTAASIAREVAFSGYSNSVSIVKGVDFTKTPLFAAVKFDFAGDTIAMFDVQQALTLGYYRIINRGGERADLNYDGLITVAGAVDGTLTFAGRYIKEIVLYGL
jgi:hypothetical protein